MDKKTGKRLKMINFFATVLVGILLIYAGYYTFGIQLSYTIVLEVAIVILGISYHIFLSSKMKS